MSILTLLFPLYQLNQKPVVRPDISLGSQQPQSLGQVEPLAPHEVGEDDGGGPAGALPAVHQHLPATLHGGLHPGRGGVEVVRDLDVGQVHDLERDERRGGVGKASPPG